MLISGMTKQGFMREIARHHISFPELDEFIYWACRNELLPVDKDKARKYARTFPAFVYETSYEAFIKDYDEMINQPDMSEDELKIIFDNRQNNDDSRKNAVINSFAYLAFSIAKEYIGMDYNYSYIDLMTAAVEGLTYSFDHFDHKAGVNYADYASWVIHYYINYDSQCIIRDIPLMSAEGIFHMRQYESLLSGQRCLREMYEREPTKEEILNYLDLTEDEINREPTEQELEEICRQLPFIHRENR